jgi:hypothetical protein
MPASAEPLASAGRDKRLAAQLTFAHLVPLAAAAQPAPDGALGHPEAVGDLPDRQTVGAQAERVRLRALPLGHDTASCAPPASHASARSALARSAIVAICSS